MITKNRLGNLVHANQSRFNLEPLETSENDGKRRGDTRFSISVTLGMRDNCRGDVEEIDRACSERFFQRTWTNRDIKIKPRFYMWRLIML